MTRALLLRQVPKPLQCTPDSKRTNDSNECAIGRVLAILSSTAQSRCTRRRTHSKGECSVSASVGYDRVSKAQ